MLVAKRITNSNGRTPVIKLKLGGFNVISDIMSHKTSHWKTKTMKQNIQKNISDLKLATKKILHLDMISENINKSKLI